MVPLVFLNKLLTQKNLSLLAKKSSLALGPPRARPREEDAGLLKAGLDGAVCRLRHRFHAAARGAPAGESFGSGAGADTAAASIAYLVGTLFRMA